MDRTHALLGLRCSGRPVLPQFTRQCAALALRGRGSGRTASAWALSGPLSWRESSKREPETSGSPSTSSRLPPPQPAADEPGPVGSSSVGNSRAGGRGPAAQGTPARDVAANAVGTLQPTSTSIAAPEAQAQLPWRRGPQPPANDQDTVLTFSYGANMNFLTLARREVRVLSRDPAIVVDPAVRLVFKHQGGYATLERAEEGAGQGGAEQDEPRFRPYDGLVHGVLYRLTRADFEKLSKREGGYLVQELQVRTYDGALHNALVFVTNPLFRLPHEVCPTEAYLSRVRDGAADNYLDPAYQAFLSGITTVPGAGLGPEYYNTPSKYMGYSFLGVVALITIAFFVQH